MVQITAYDAPGLASLLPMMVAAALLVLIKTARHMGYRLAGLTVPPVLGRAVVEDGRPAPWRRSERRTPTPVNQPASGYG